MSLLDGVHRRGWGRGTNYEESIDVDLEKGSKRSKILGSREI